MKEGTVPVFLTVITLSAMKPGYHSRRFIYKKPMNTLSSTAA
jgi:hypothetical protein